MYTICFRTIYSSTQVLAIKLRYSEIVLKIFLELNSGIVDRGGGGEILLVLCIITMYFFVFCFFGCICFGHVFRVNQWFSNVLEVEFRNPEVPTAGSFEIMFDSFTFHLLSQESHTCFQDFIIHLWYLFIIIISKLAVLHYILGCCYYHSQSVYVCDNIMNFCSFSEIWSRTLSFQKKKCYLFDWKPFKNDKKCFLFHLKSSFPSQDI